jgi:hypothetical protein
MGASIFLFKNAWCELALMPFYGLLRSNVFVRGPTALTKSSQPVNRQSSSSVDDAVASQFAKAAIS